MNILVLDTETTNGLDDSLVYDIGFCVVNEKGDTLAKRSFAIRDLIFCDDLMASAYYKDKLPQYFNDIQNGKRELKSFNQVRKIINYYIDRYNIKYISCHNARFDYNALNTTQRYRTSSKYRYFLPYNITIIDTLKLSRLVLKNNNEYNTFCEVNNYKTKRNQNRYTAEVLYRFISGNNDFVEVHQGLQDTEIEAEILTYCLQFVNIEDGKLWA